MSFSWIDFFILVAAVFFIWSGSSRGVIMELFEFLIVTLNVLLCSHLYGPLSYFFVTFIHTPSLVASVISYVFFFLLFAVILWILAGKAQIAANIRDSVGPNRFGGAVFGFLKGLLIVWAFLFALAQIPLSKDSLDVLHASPTVQAVQSLTGPIDSALETAGSKRAYHTMHPLLMKSVF